MDGGYEGDESKQAVVGDIRGWRSPMSAPVGVGTKICRLTPWSRAHKALLD